MDDLISTHAQLVVLFNVIKYQFHWNNSDMGGGDIEYIALFSFDVFYMFGISIDVSKHSPV